LKYAGFFLSLALLPACSSRAADTANTNLPAILPDGTRVYTNLYYVPNGMERQNLDLYLPAKGTNWPLIIWIHGGGWNKNSKDHPGGRSFLGRGYALASLNYRQAQHAKWPAQIIDCKAAVRWLRAHAGEYGIDPDHFGAWGMSSGGHMVAVLGTTGDTKEFDQGDNLGFSSRVQAVADWFGPTDFLSVSNEPGHMRWGGNGDVDTSLIGGKPSQNVEKARSASPVQYVTSNAPPFLIMHGDKDLTVPVQQSYELRDALKKAGAPVEFLVLVGSGHGGKEFESREAMGWLNEFFDKYLKGGPVPSGKAVGGK
jgi:acetyl esterase/lipase